MHTRHWKRSQRALKQVLPHGPGRNRVAAREQLDAGLGQVLAFLGLGDDDQPCALQVRQTCRVLFVLRGGELFESDRCHRVLEGA